MLREGEVIEKERGENDGQEARSESGENSDAGDEDEAESERGSVESRGADAEGDAHPGEADGGDVTTDLDQKAGLARRAWTWESGQIAASWAGRASQ
jgi:hypothetical protein